MDENNGLYYKKKIFIEEKTEQLCSNRIRLPFSNKTVGSYNKTIWNRQENRISSRAFILGRENDERRDSAQKSKGNKTLSTDA